MSDGTVPEGASRTARSFRELCDWANTVGLKMSAPLGWAAERIHALEATLAAAEWSDDVNGYVLEPSPEVVRVDHPGLPEIERLRLILWSMASNRAPKHPDDTHVEAFMPINVWREFRP